MSGILQRLVLAFGHRQHHHLVRLAEVERGRADEIADVLDEEHRLLGRLQPLERAFHHARVEVAALAGVDLQRGRAGRADALGVVGGLLVALDHRDRQGRQQPLDRLGQQRRLARAGARHEVDREDAALGEELAVEARVLVVLREDVLLDLDHPRRRQAGRVRVAVVMDVIVTAARAVRVIVPVAVSVVVVMARDRGRGRDRDRGRGGAPCRRHADARVRALRLRSSFRRCRSRMSCT